MNWHFRSKYNKMHKFEVPLSMEYTIDLWSVIC